MSNEYLETFLQLQESLRDQLRAAPTDEEAELINEDLAIVDDAIASINAENEKHSALMRKRATSIISLTPEQIARRNHLTALREKLSDPERSAPVRGLSAANATELALLDQIYDATQARAREDEKYTELMRIGKSAADPLREMVAALEVDYDRLEELRGKDSDMLFEAEVTELAELEAQAGECESREDAEQRIQEDALSVEMRGDWYGASGDGKDDPPTEFKILLSTGGPATQICGELSDGEPRRAWLEVQDWGTPWTEYREDGLSAVLLAYARCFYFREG